MKISIQFPCNFSVNLQLFKNCIFYKGRKKKTWKDKPRIFISDCILVKDFKWLFFLLINILKAVLLDFDL